MDFKKLLSTAHRVWTYARSRQPRASPLRIRPAPTPTIEVAPTAILQ